MTVIGYIRVTTEKQDLEKQRHLLLEYAYQQKLKIDEFIEVEISSRKNQRERRISELRDKLRDGDLLIVAELSRLGRNMLETLNPIMDHTPMLDLVRWSRFRWGIQPKIGVGDSRYATVSNIVGLEEDGIRAFLPLPSAISE